MPRVASIVLPSVAHHATQRGNNRQDVFFVDDGLVRMVMELGSNDAGGTWRLQYDASQVPVDGDDRAVLSRV